MNEKGEVVGKHPGSLFMTIGERHGFTIDAKYKTPNDDRYYVVSKDVKKNIVTVSNKKSDQSVTENEIMISRVNWSCNVPKVGEQIQIRVRYRQPLVEATVKSINSTSVSIEPSIVIDAITPGQSLVMYRGVECLGGGIIE